MRRLTVSKFICKKDTLQRKHINICALHFRPSTRQWALRDPYGATWLRKLYGLPRFTGTLSLVRLTRTTHHAG